MRAGWRSRHPAPRLRRLAGTAVATAGAALLALAASLVLNQEAEPGNDGGDVVEQLLAEPMGEPRPPVRPLAAAPVHPVTSGELPPAREVIPPERLVVPVIDADVRIVPVGVTASGVMELPSVSEAGWYRFGPGIDADSGSIVLAGHVDSASEGRGALFRLSDVGVRDQVTLHGDNGEARAFRVIGRRIWPKTAVPLDRLFAKDGEPRLVLITCGGDFDRSSQTYADNVVIVAVPEQQESEESGQIDNLQRLPAR